MDTFSSSYNIRTRCVGLSVVGPYLLVFSIDSACLGSPERKITNIKQRLDGGRRIKIDYQYY